MHILAHFFLQKETTLAMDYRSERRLALTRLTHNCMSALGRILHILGPQLKRISNFKKLEKFKYVHVYTQKRKTCNFHSIFG